MTLIVAPAEGEHTLRDLSRRVTAHGDCVGAPDPDAWFPSEPTTRSGAAAADVLAARRADYEATARKLCGGCLVRSECLELALAEEADLPRTWIHGIRGGLAPWERESIIRNQRRRAARQAGNVEAVA